MWTSSSRSLFAAAMRSGGNGRAAWSRKNPSWLVGSVARSAMCDGGTVAPSTTPTMTSSSGSHSLNELTGQRTSDVIKFYFRWKISENLHSLRGALGGEQRLWSKMLPVDRAHAA